MSNGVAGEADVRRTMKQKARKTGWGPAGLARVLAIAVLASSVATGCVGVDPGSSGSGLIMADPLMSLAPAAWYGAPASCEGLLAGEVDFAVANIDAGLIAAIDAGGRIICVDTVGAVEEELEESGREAEAAALVSAFRATLAAAGMLARPRMGDPDPQPNLGRFAGDPDPQPN